MGFTKVSFVPKAFSELTKEELRSMIRCGYMQRQTSQEMCGYYQVDPDAYFDGIREKGLSVTREERDFWFKWRQGLEKTKQEEQTSKHRTAEHMYKECGHDHIDEIPDYIICAIYDVHYEIIDGKRYYDKQDIKRAREQLAIKVRRYMLKEEDIQGNAEQYSELRPIELVAMRMYRGYNRKKFSKTSGLSLNTIVETESKSNKVPKWIANIYKETLQIKSSHINQLRAILNGKAGHVEEDRQIPKLIKIKVWARDKGKCSRCSSKEKLHFHHKERFAEGGQHTVENLTLLCVSCHAEEHKGEKSYYMLKKQAEGMDADGSR